MGEIDITVKSPNGTQVQRITIDPKLKVAQLITIVAQKFGFKEEEMSLVYSGSHLNNKKEQTIESVGIEDGSLLFFIMRLKGGLLQQ